jgi:hypothetical protein
MASADGMTAMAQASPEDIKAAYQGGDDYDYAAAQAAGVQPDERGHLPDTYKKPNHITFSDESIYNNKNGEQGGQWRKDDKGKWTFTPGPSNLKRYTPEQLKEYFQKYEPDATLNLPPPKRSPTGR